MDQYELNRIIYEHKKWLRSNEAAGSPADLSNQDLRGADLRHEILSGANLKRANLSKANLAGANLNDAHLNAAILSEACLEGAELNRASLVGANLTQANLVGAKFFRADLQRANLKGADLTAAELIEAELGEAVFHDAQLKRAVFRAKIDDEVRQVKDLSETQLAGSNVFNCRLPDSVKDFDGLKHAEEISRQARTIFLMVIGACLFSWLTIATTTDLALIQGLRNTPLPVIQTDVPIVGFYWAAPAILLGLYAYLHLYLQNLWTTLSNLPAVLPDGQPLDQEAYQWMATSLVRAYVVRLREDRPRYSRASVFFTVVCAWCFVPGTILVFWARYLPRHDPWGTYWLVSLVAITVWWGIESFLSMRKKLRGELRSGMGHVKREEHKPLARLRGGVRRVATPTVATMVALMGCGIISSYALKGEMVCFGKGSTADFHAKRLKERYANAGLLGHMKKPLKPLFPAWLTAHAGPEEISANSGQSQAHETTAGSEREEPPGFWEQAKWRLDSWLRADVIDEKISKPDKEWEKTFSEWTENPEKVAKPSFQGPRLAGMNLRFARIESSCLVGAFLEKSELEGAILYKVDLRMARFWSEGARAANLRNTFLRKANLQGADLRRANLQGADLREAKLQGSDLWRAKLQDSDLWQANLRGAKFREANLQGAKLWQANLQGAYLREAKLQGADLWRAKLQGAYLMGAKLQGAKLERANLQGAKLWRAKLQGAYLMGANLEKADLSNVDRIGKTSPETDKQEPTPETQIDFNGAKLWGALLYGADLKTAVNLTKDQVDEACCDEDTELPPHLDKAICVENGLTVKGGRFE